MPLEDHPRRPAQQAPRYRIQREALALVRPVTKQLGNWQVRIAHLRGLAEQRHRVTTSELLQLIAAAETLHRTIGEEQRAFRIVAGRASPELKSHAVLADTERALSNVLTAVSAVLATLGERRNG